MPRNSSSRLSSLAVLWPIALAGLVSLFSLVMLAYQYVSLQIVLGFCSAGLALSGWKTVKLYQHTRRATLGQIKRLQQRKNSEISSLTKQYEAARTQLLLDYTTTSAQLENLLKLATDRLILLDPHGHIIRLSATASSLLNRPEAELLGQTLSSQLNFADAQRLRTRLERPIHEAMTINLPSFPNKPLKLELMPLPAPTGGYLAVLSDPSTGQQDTTQLQDRLATLMRTTGCSVWEYTPSSESYWWSDEFAAMLGYNDGELSMSLASKHALIHPEDIDWVKTAASRYLTREADEYNPEFRIKRKDGSWMWVEERGTAQWTDDSAVLRFSGTVIDCTERKRFEQQMMYMATHDSLTDLPNRTLLNDRLEHALSGNQRKGLNVAVLLLDIDRFKLINDSLGHEIGDQLIRAVAKRLQQSLRPTDTLARLGGDEFVVICEDLASPQEAARVSKRLLSAMTASLMVEGNALTIGISIGISVSPVDGLSAADILRHADTAMHSAKTAGGNTYRFFVNEMNKEAVQRLTLERHLNEAIEQQQFLLHYQPKVDLQTLEVVSAEALIRWPHRKLGNVSPAQFVPIAEETGPILAMGEWVLRETLSQLCFWRERGYQLIPIAVNLSGKQLMAGGVDELVLRLLKEYDIPAHLLELEVTESVMARMDKMLPPLQRLREAGLNIALDDFGTGYSSLSYLRQLPITALKIDRSFVKDVEEKSEARSIARIITEIGRELGFQVVAEGIETTAQLEFLRSSGCHLGQGWHFAKALPAPLLEKKLKKSQA